MAMAKWNILQRGRVVIRQLSEGISFTLNELKSNKFRAFLSLLSVSIGIFTIVSILTAVDTLEKNVKSVFESFNTNQVVVSKWPMMSEDDEGNQEVQSAFNGGEYRWWDYMRRPSISYDDYKFLKNNISSAEVVSYSVYESATAKYGRKSISNTSVMLITEGFDKTQTIKLGVGRNLSVAELNSGSHVAVIGYSIAESLFENSENALGKMLNLNGYSIAVVGVNEKFGESTIVNMSSSPDQIIYIPYLFGKQVFSLRDPDGEIAAIAKENVSNDELSDEIRLKLRNFRRIRYGEKINFSVNKYNFLDDILNAIVSSLSNIGWIIAIFSLLIGGFGIANIMFVSVKERTKIIGIQKALGAKKYFIMIQFLTEAAIMAIAGAVVGLFLVWIIILILPVPDTYDVSLSLSNILLGLNVATVIGLISGVLPAYSAANLNPVDAINSK